MPAQWVFDPIPPSGARLGGDVAERAFRPEISVFVREVLQNAKDQHLNDLEAATVRFDLAVIEGEELKDFLTALHWDQLHPHLAAAAQQPNGKSLQTALTTMERDQKLLLLAVHDGHTTGLLGSETGQGNFAALCRDRLFSEKNEKSAGGSHGLGKAVLWRFSSLATVAFCSTLSKLEPGQENPRFIARTNLPWHELQKEQFAGDGWLGRQTKAEGGARAESLWGNDAAELAKKLGAGRAKMMGPGTSIVVLGFQEPADESRPASEMVAAITEATADSFWPSLRADGSAAAEGGPSALRVQVRLGEGQITAVDDFERVGAFVECVDRYRAGHLSPTLERPGDVIALPIPIHLPARTDGRKSMDAEATLLVRLAEPNARTAHLNRVACVRGAGMVVEYKPFERLSLTARPFHAVLLCGIGRGTKTPGDEALETFLRASEPPEHDRWLSTVRLKEQYKPGYKKALDELFEQVRQKLREAVAEKIKVGTAGPELLAKKFPIGPGEGGAKTKQPFHFRSLKGQLTETGAWRFSGEARADEAVPDGWEVTVDLRFGGEGRGRHEQGLIQSFVIDKDSNPKAVSRLDNGRAVVQLQPNVQKFSFMGESDPTRHPVDAQLSVSELVLESRRMKVKR